MYLKLVTGVFILNHDVHAFLTKMAVLILANSTVPDEMQHHAAFHLVIYCLPQCHSRGFQYTKGKQVKIH